MSEKVYMLNALWFKADGGAEKYQEYGAAAAPLVAKYGGHLVTPAFSPHTALIGDFDPDVFFVVEYPDWESFRSLPDDPDYQAIAHLREEAIDKSVLIACRSLGDGFMAEQHRM